MEKMMTTAVAVVVAVLINILGYTVCCIDGVTFAALRQADTPYPMTAQSLKSNATKAVANNSAARRLEEMEREVVGRDWERGATWQRSKRRRGLRGDGGRRQGARPCLWQSPKKPTKMIQSRARGLWRYCGHGERAGSVLLHLRSFGGWCR